MQKIQVIGNIGQSAKINEHNGRKAISFSVAVNRKYFNNDGVAIESTNWYNCTKWVHEGKITEIAKYLSSGTKVFVEGVPGINTYTNSEGKLIASQSVDVRAIELLSAKREEEGDPQKNSTNGLSPNYNFDQ